MSRGPKGCEAALRAGAHERSWTARRLWHASIAIRHRQLDTALSRRCLLRLIGGAAALQIPTFALARFDFFLSEYTATRAELQAEMAKRFPLQQRYAELFTVTLRDPQLGLDRRTIAWASPPC